MLMLARYVCGWCTKHNVRLNTAVGVIAVHHWIEIEEIVDVYHTVPAPFLIQFPERSTSELYPESGHGRKPFARENRYLRRQTVLDIVRVRTEDGETARESAEQIVPEHIVDKQRIVNHPATDTLIETIAETDHYLGIPVITVPGLVVVKTICIET